MIEPVPQPIVRPLRSVVIFLDLDHTLIENPFGSVVFPRLCESLGLQAGIAPEAIFAALMAESRRRRETGAGAVQEVDWQDIAEVVAAGLRTNLTESVSDLVKQHSGPPHCHAYPGAHEALEAIGRMGWSRVASSKGLWRYQGPVLSGLGLLPHFDGLAMPDIVGVGKTDAAFYAPFVTQANTVVTVGDNLLEDVSYPQSLGYRTVLRRFDHRAHTVAAVLAQSDTAEHVRADAEIDSLAELMTTLEQLVLRG